MQQCWKAALGVHVLLYLMLARGTATDIHNLASDKAALLTAKASGKGWPSSWTESTDPCADGWRGVGAADGHQYRADHNADQRIIKKIHLHTPGVLTRALSAVGLEEERRLTFVSPTPFIIILSYILPTPA